jgi:hypothetical protein
MLKKKNTKQYIFPGIPIIEFRHFILHFRQNRTPVSFRLTMQNPECGTG